MARAAAAAREELDEEAGGPAGGPWKTVLFNCDCHTFDAVEKIVMRATRCTLSHARRISHEVHTRGSARVYEGVRERCEAVAEVIASIGLRVEVVR